MPLVPDVKNVDISVKRAIQGLSKKLGYTGSPVFSNTTITNVITAGTSVFSKTCLVAAGLNVLRVTGLQTDDTALTGTLRGAYIDVSNGSTVATGTIRGMELKARTEAPGDSGSNVAVLEGLSISADSKDHSVTTVMRAAEFILDGSTGGTIAEAVGLRIANNLQADKATLSYGLQIYRDSFDYTYDISLSLGGHITGDSYVNQDLRTTASPTHAGLTLTGLTASSLVGTNASKLLESVTIGLGLDYTTATLKLSHLGIQDLIDPGADRIFFWDDDASKSEWLVPNTLISITGTNLNVDSDLHNYSWTSVDATDLKVGSATQAWDAQLDDIAALAVTDGNFIVGDGANWVAESAGTARTSIGLGTTATPIFAKLTVQDTTIETTIGYIGFYNDHRKTAGVTDHLDYFYGHQNYIVYNQTGGIIGESCAFYNQFSLVDGDVGDASNSKNLNGVYSFVDLNAGKVYGNIFGFQTVIDQEAANEVTGNIYGNYINIDADGTVGGSVYGLYLNEGSNVDYGIYQNGTAPNVFGGNITMPATGTISFTGNLNLVSTGDVIGFRNSQANERSIFRVMPNGTVGTVASALEFFGTDFVADFTNYERLQIYGDTTTGYQIYTYAAGTGTLRPLILFTDGNTNQLNLAVDGGISMATLKSGTDQANAGAAADELYHDTDDNTIKIGV